MIPFFSIFFIKTNIDCMLIYIYENDSNELHLTKWQSSSLSIIFLNHMYEEFRFLFTPMTKKKKQGETSQDKGPVKMAMLVERNWLVSDRCFLH